MLVYLDNSDRTEKIMAKSANLTELNTREEKAHQIALNKLASMQSKYDAAIERMNHIFQEINELFSLDDIPISESQTHPKPFFDALFSRHSAQIKELYSDTQLQALSERYETISKKKTAFLVSHEKQIKRYAKDDSTLSAEALITKTTLYQSITHVVNDCCTDAQTLNKSICIRLTTINKKITAFTSHRQSFMDLFEELQVYCETSEMNPDYQQDKETHRLLQSLSILKDALAAMLREKNEGLLMLTSAEGRRSFPVACERYQRATEIYLLAIQQLVKLVPRIKTTKKSLLDIDTQLTGCKTLYLDTLASLKSLCHIKEANYAPYNEFSMIRQHVELLNLTAGVLDDDAIMREAQLQSIEKQDGWIEKTLRFEAIAHEQLYSFRSRIQKQRLPITHKVDEIRKQIDATKQRIESNKAMQLHAIQALKQTFVTLLTNANNMKLNESALVAAANSLSDINLHIKGFELITDEAISLSDATLYHDADKIFDNQLILKNDILTEIRHASQTLSDSIIQEKQAYNHRVGKELTEEKKIQQLMASPEYQYDAYFLDNGCYDYTMQTKQGSLTVVPNRNTFYFKLPNHIREEINALYFPTPLTDDPFDDTFIKKETKRKTLSAPLDVLNAKDQVFNTARAQRNTSEEIVVVRTIKAAVTAQIKEGMAKNHDPRRKLLKDIYKQLSTLETNYLHLQIEDKKTFVSDAIKTVQNAITHNNLERLSDLECYMFTQFVRICVFKPLYRLAIKCHLINVGHLTFFAGKLEKDMMRCGMTAINELKLVEENARHNVDVGIDVY